VSLASLVNVSDNCCIGQITLGASSDSNVTFGCSNRGTNNLSVRVRDCHDRSTFVSVQVVVVDNTPPVLTASSPTPRVVYLDAQCAATITSTALVNASDACQPVVLTPATHSFNGLNCGDTIQVTISARDASQNLSTIVVPVIVQDTIRPVVNYVPANVSVGKCDALIYYNSPSASDNCGLVLVTQTSGRPSGSTFPVGLTTNTFRLTDICGNFREVSFTVRVADFVVSFSPPSNRAFCSLDSSYVLPSALGVSYSGSGIVGNRFYPTQASVGANVITWIFVDSSGCDTSASFTFEVLESPSLPEIIRVGSTRLEVSQPFDEYQWYRGTSAIPAPGGTRRWLDISISGVYTVRVKGPSGCYRLSNPVGIGVGVGIEEFNAEGINLYPNPNSGSFTISIDDFDYSLRNVVVMDITGREVFKDDMTEAIRDFNLGHLAQGRYIVRITGQRGTSIKSLIINY